MHGSSPADAGTSPASRVDAEPTGAPLQVGSIMARADTPGPDVPGQDLPGQEVPGQEVPGSHGPGSDWAGLVVPGPVGESTTSDPQPVGTTADVPRVDVTELAAGMLRDLTEQHGPLMFHQSGGCCDGSSPMCYPDGDFWLSEHDVHLGDLDVGLDRAVPVWMSASQFELWRHTHLTIDAVPGRGAGFSVEGPTGYRFLIRSRVFTDAELAALPPVGRGGQQ